MNTTEIEVSGAPNGTGSRFVRAKTNRDYLSTQCRSINDLYGGYNKCSFLVANNACRSGDSVVDYMYLAFCTIDSTHYYGPVAAAAFLFLMFFISLGITADDL